MFGVTTPSVSPGAFGGGAFGQPAAQPAPGGFGAAASAATPAFGAAPAGGLFGATQPAASFGGLGKAIRDT